VTQTNFPSSLSEYYQYDADNNLTQKTDRKGQTIQYLYDALNRLTSKTYPDTTAVDYTYDLVGKIQQVNDPTGTYAFAYDNMGRLIGTTTSYSFLTSRRRVARPLIWNLWVPCPRFGEGGGFVSPMAGFSRFFRAAAFRQTLIGPENNIGANRFSILL
jgi:YD repeat-containing protein